MTRRHFVLTMAAAAGRAGTPARLVVPIHRIVDSRALCGFQTGGREFRIDRYATGLWVCHDGAAVRKSARACLGRLRSADAARRALE